MGNFEKMKKRAIEKSIMLEVNNLEPLPLETKREELIDIVETVKLNGADNTFHLLKDDILKEVDYNSNKLKDFLIDNATEFNIDEEDIFELKNEDLSNDEVKGFFIGKLSKLDLKKDFKNKTEEYIGFEMMGNKINIAFSPHLKEKMGEVKTDFFRDVATKDFVPLINENLEKIINEKKNISDGKSEITLDDFDELREELLNKKIETKLPKNDINIKRDSFKDEYLTFLEVNKDEISDILMDKISKTVSDNTFVKDNKIEFKNSNNLLEKENAEKTDFENEIKIKETKAKDEFADNLARSFNNLTNKENYTRKDLIMEEIDDLYLVQLNNKKNNETEFQTVSKNEMNFIVDLKTNTISLNDIDKSDREKYQKVLDSDLKISVIPNDKKSDLADFVLDELNKPNDEKSFKEKIKDIAIKIEESQKEIVIDDKILEKAKQFKDAINEIDDVLDTTFDYREKGNIVKINFDSNEISKFNKITVEDKANNIVTHFNLYENESNYFADELIDEFKSNTPKGENKEKLEKLEKFKNDFSPNALFDNVKNVENFSFENDSGNGIYNTRHINNEKSYNVSQSKENPSLNLMLSVVDKDFSMLIEKGIGDVVDEKEIAISYSKILDKEKEIISHFEKDTINKMNGDIKFHTITNALKDFEKSEKEDKTILDFVGTNLDEIYSLRTEVYEKSEDVRDKFLKNNAETFKIPLNYYNEMMLDDKEKSETTKEVLEVNKEMILSGIHSDYYETIDRLKDKSFMSEKIVNENLYNNYLLSKDTDTIDMQKQLINDIANSNLVSISFDDNKSEKEVKEEMFEKFNSKLINYDNLYCSKEYFDKTVDKILEDETYKNIDFSGNSGKDYNKDWLKEKYDEIEKYALTRNEVKKVEEKPIKSKNTVEEKEVEKDREIDF
jgi:hypothetical protein